LEKNAGIKNGSVKGVPMNLKYMGIGDGLTVRPFPNYFPLPLVDKHITRTP
jgi:hypothetical protein